jgi:hypothetical protein
MIVISLLILGSSFLNGLFIITIIGQLLKLNQDERIHSVK